MNFPDKQCNPALARAYNARATALMEEIVDFLQIHYRTSNREEPYWKAVRRDTKLSDWLRERMELWQCRFPDMDDTGSHTLFDFSNFIYALLPKGYFAKIHPPLENSIRREDWQAYGRELNDRVTKMLNSLPSHYELLTAIRAGVSSPKKESRTSIGTFGQPEAPVFVRG